MADIVCDIRNHLLTMAPHQRQRLTACQLRVAADEIDRLREAIRRLAEQDATLSVCEGNVTVTMDATLTDAEREAVGDGVRCCEYLAAHPPLESRADLAESAATLRGLLERCSPESDRPQPIAPLSDAGKSAIPGQCNT